MNSEELKNLIESARIEKGISQRELAKLTGISRSTLNDIVNGKIKKIKLDDLYQISIPLGLNLENLLEDRTHLKCVQHIITISSQFLALCPSTKAVTFHPPSHLMKKL